MSIVKFNHKSILKQMFKDQLVSATEAKRIDTNISKSNKLDQNPLLAINTSLPTHVVTEKSIPLDDLCEWFAGAVNLDFFLIDPLKIYIASVTNIVSSDYA